MQGPDGERRVMRVPTTATQLGAMPPAATATPLPTTVPVARRAGVPVGGGGGGRQPQPAGGTLYGGYTAAQLTGNPALVARLGPAAAARWRAHGAGASPPASTPGAPAPAPSTPPAPGPPVGGSPFTPIPSPPGPTTGSPPVPTPGGPQPYSLGQSNEFLDPMMMFLSAVPGMRMNTQRAIGDAMATAGGTGNRWGTSAQRTAGEIGAESAMQENAMLQGMLANYANQQENRALQATGQGMGLGGMLDQMAQSRVQLPFQVGQYEQQRQDNLANTQFQDWSANRLGWLGPMLQAAMSQGAGSPAQPGQIYQTSTAGSPGASDYLTLLAQLFG